MTKQSTQLIINKYHKKELDRSVCFFKEKKTIIDLEIRDFYSTWRLGLS